MVKHSLQRRAFALAGAALALGIDGCAADDLRAAATDTPAAPRDGLLTPWLTITGGWRTDPQSPAGVAGAARVAGPRLNFMQPVGVAAQGDVLLVADAGARTLWRVDRPRDAMSAFAPFTGSIPDQGTSMQMGIDFSAWVALPSEHMVVQYDARGRIVRRWSDEADASRPVAVAVPDSRAEVLVGDAATARIVAFDPLGRARRVLGAGQPGALQSIGAMCLGPRGLYVLDRIAQVVVVMGPNGEVLDLIGENELMRPRALAVDRAGRVFVADDGDQRIKVFRGAQMIASAGGTGNGPGRFGRIESLAVDGNLLYAADSQNARVQVLLVAPPSMEEPGAPR
jgi:hypothetical protein